MSRDRRIPRGGSSKIFTLLVLVTVGAYVVLVVLDRQGRPSDPSDGAVVELAGRLRAAGDGYQLDQEGGGDLPLILRPEVADPLVGRRVVLRVRYVDGGPQFRVLSLEAQP